MFDEPVLLCRETKGAKGERLDVCPRPQERRRLFLDPRASPKGDERVELCDQSLKIPTALRPPLAQLSLDFCEVASRHGNLDANGIEQVLVAFHAQTLRTPLQPPRFLLVPQQDMDAGASEQSPDVQRARRRNIGGHHRLGMGCELTDRLRLAGGPLEGDQRRNGVPPVVRLGPIRRISQDPNMRARSRPSLAPPGPALRALSPARSSLRPFRCRAGASTSRSAWPSGKRARCTSPRLSQDRRIQPANSASRSRKLHHPT